MNETETSGSILSPKYCFYFVKPVNFLLERYANKQHVHGFINFPSIYPRLYANYSQVNTRNTLCLHISIIQRLFILYQIIQKHK